MISHLCYMIYFYDWENGKYPPIEMKQIRKVKKIKLDYKIVSNNLKDMNLITEYFT